MKMRMHMAEADASPGSGAVAPAAAPTEPQASGAAPSPAVDAATVAAISAAVRDSLFAELRRSGALGKPDKKADAPANNGQSSASSPDLGRLRQLDRALARSGHGANLKDSAIARMEGAFLAEAPDDAAVWVKDYLDGYGVAAPQHVNQSQTAAPPARTGPSVSDGGAPPPAARVPLEEQKIYRMSPTDRDAYRNQIGLAEFVKRTIEQGKSVKFTK